MRSWWHALLDSGDDAHSMGENGPEISEVTPAARFRRRPRLTRCGWEWARNQHDTSCSVQGTTHNLWERMGPKLDQHGTPAAQLRRQRTNCGQEWARRSTFISQRISGDDAPPVDKNEWQFMGNLCIEHTPNSINFTCAGCGQSTSPGSV